MPLSDGEKQRARYHLGYPSLSTAASIQLGVPALTQTNFLVENALNRLLEESLPQVRAIVACMDGIETKLIEAQDRLAATQLSDLHLRENEPDMLEAEYQRWGYRLADIIGSPVYPYSMRYMGGGAGRISNMTVSG
jgi:hypothetical protein